MLLPIILLGVLPSPQQPSDLEPKLDGVRLAVGGEELAPLRSGRVDDWSEFGGEGWRVRLTPTVAWVARADAQERAEAIDLPTPPPGRELHTLVISEDTAYLTDPEAVACRLLRLDLKRRAWLAPFELSDESLGLEKREGVRSTARTILCQGSSVYVHREDTSDEGGRGPDRVGYVVARLDRLSGKPIWTRNFATGESTARPGAVLMAPNLTLPTRPWTRALQLLGKDLLVCAGGAASVVRIEVEKGETKWSVDRLWEYQRGYTGPSVWGHHLGRFGIYEVPPPPPEALTPESKAYLEERKKEFDNRQGGFNAVFIGSIVGGPFIVREQNPWKIPRPRILVVAALSPRDPWSEQLAQQFVYELDSSGTPCSVVALPRGMLGWAAQTIDDRVVFACTHGAWATVSSSESGGSSSMGGPWTKFDVLARLLWYREITPSARKPWMECDPAGDPIALTPDLGVRTAGGGWIEKEGDTLFHFPLHVVDPRDGGSRELELRVPFDGAMTRPAVNYQGDARSAHVWGWRGLALTRLELAGERLLVWLANSNQVWKLEFDARSLVPAK
jgi:hypothetical protein